MKPFHEIQAEQYVLLCKYIDKGSIKICTTGEFDDNEKQKTRPTDSLELILMVNPNPNAGRGCSFSEEGKPIYVLGIIEKGSYDKLPADPSFPTTERISRVTDLFINHPELGLLETSPQSSGLIPLQTYKNIFEKIRSTEDFLEVKKFLRKYFEK